MARWMVLFAICCATGCGNKKQDGEAPTPPVETPPPTSTAPAPPPSTPTGSGAAAAPASPTLISGKGIGPVTDLMQGDRDDEEQRKLLAAALEPLGLTVAMDVMDLPGEVETEEGYFSVKKGDTEVLQIFRGDAAKPKMTVHVIDPMFGTDDGIEVGDTVTTLANKRPDVACTVEHANPLGLLTCRSSRDSGVTFVLDARGFKGDRFVLTANSDRRIVEIVL